ncbi:MAG: hypothetical protein AAF573_04550 [Bacteroidota bacterium]
MKKEFHKINEYYLIPALFFLSSMAVIALVYFINEYFKSEEDLKNYYLLDTQGIINYKSSMLISIATLIGLLLAKVAALKYKHWIFSSGLIIIYTIVLWICIREA